MSRLPLTLPLDYCDFTDACQRLAKAPGFGCIDARSSHPSQGRHSLLVAFPSQLFSLAGGFITVDGHTVIDSPADALARFCEGATALRADPYLPFSGGIVGFIGFEGACALRGFEPAAGFSRHSQCRLGLYPAAITFDHLEGCAWIVANGASLGEADQHADQLLECLQEDPSTQPRADDASLHAREDDRLHPPEASFRNLAQHATALIRAESAERLHLIRQTLSPSSGCHPIDLLQAERREGSIRALFTHEGATYAPGSSELLLDLHGGEICSTIRGLIERLPAARFTGAPEDVALRFIREHDGTPRHLYGGAFGIIDGRGLRFWSVDRLLTDADGALTTTCGMDLTEHYHHPVTDHQ